MISNDTLYFPGAEPGSPSRLTRLAATVGAVLVATLALTAPALAKGGEKSSRHQATTAATNGSSNGSTNRSTNGGNNGGNNGTIKLDGSPLSGGHSNHPHLACQLNLEFFGFDKGTNTADVTIEGQSPSGSGSVPVSNGAPLHFTFTGNGAGGAFDVAQLYTLNTNGLAMHPKQGFHIKWSASVNGGNAKHKVIWVQPCAPAGKPDLALDKNGPATGTAGGTGTYTIDVKNIGATKATAPLTVTDTLPAGETATSVTAGSDFSCSLTGAGSGVSCTRATDLAAGASTSQIVVHISYGAQASGSLVNTARVAAVQGETNLANNVDTVKTKLTRTTTGPCTENIFHNTQSPASGATVVPGQLLSAVYSDETPIGNGSNGGNAPILTVDGVVQTAGLSVVPTSGPDRYNSLLSYRLPTSLADGLHTVTIMAFDSDQNKPGGDCDIASWSLTVKAPAAPDVSIIKAGPQSSVRPGARFTYTLTAANTGTVAATGVRIVDALPTGLSLVSVTGTGWTCVSGLIDCTFGPALPVGGSAAISVVVDLAANYTGTSIVNTATVRPDDATPGDNTSTLITPVQQGGLAQPDLSLVKTGSSNAVRPGALVPYRLTVRNTGTVSTSGFTVTDPLAAGLTLVSASGAGFSCTGPGVSCTYVGTLAPGASAVIAVVTRLASTYSALSVANTAVVGPPDATPADNTSTFTVPVRHPRAPAPSPTPARPITGTPEGPATGPPPTAIPFTGAPVGVLLILAGLLILVGGAARFHGAPRAQT